MFERVFIDNFRCLINCEIKLEATSLLLGQNGSGKSSVFDVAAALSRFVGGKATTSEAFRSSELTRWQTLNEQRFELDLRRPHGLYRYALKLIHDPERRRSRVIAESLTLDGNPLFESVGDELQLYNDRYTKGPRFSGYESTRSGLPVIQERHDNHKLVEFRRRLTDTLFVRPCPMLMTSDSQEESEHLSPLAENFASWYRFIARHDISRQIRLFKELNSVIEGFESISLEGPADATATMRVQLKSPGGGKALSLKLGELSDGQRQLLLLYAVLFGVNNESRTLFLDEPDNFVAIREVQPWLSALTDAAGRSVAQAVLISHHPEIIDQLAREKGVWFSRDGGGPTRVERGLAVETGPLRPSEIEARGWR